MRFFRWIYDHLSDQRRWRVVYPDGKQRSIRMRYAIANDYRKIFGGRLEYAPL